MCLHYLELLIQNLNFLLLIMALIFSSELINSSIVKTVSTTYTITPNDTLSNALSSNLKGEKFFIIIQLQVQTELQVVIYNC